MKTDLTPQSLSTLIGSIYDCALEPERWPDTLTRLRLELDFANASISLLSLSSGSLLLSIMTGPDPIWLERMPQYAADVVEAWGGAEKMLTFPIDEPIVLSWVRDRSELAKNRAFRDWGRPQGLHDVMAIPLAIDRTVAGSVAFGRHDSQGQIGNAEVDAARLLLPHIQRAVAISKLLDVKSVVASSFEAAFDTLTVAVVLVDADLHIVHANGAARALLSENRQIGARRGVLTVLPQGVGAALGAAVRQAAQDETKIGRRGFGIPAATSDGMACVLHMLPLRYGVLRPGLAPAAVAAIFIAPATSPAGAPLDALGALFDLTPAEQRVFRQVALGLTRSEVARSLGIEAATVKTHLEHIFAKTGTRRQAELVALGASISLPLRS